MTTTNITLAQLRILTAIVEEASFSAAAARIGMTQSGASQAMRALETALGVRLLTRHRGGVEPTEIGRSVLCDARDAVAAIERVQQRCAAAAGLAAGRLRVGAVASAATRLLPNVLARFRTAWPAIELALLEGTDREVLDWVETGIVDVGLTPESSAATVVRAIAEDDFVLLVHRDHPLAGAPCARLREIAADDFLMSGSGCEPAIRRLFEAAGTAPRVALTVRDGGALMEMVAQGFGVTIMPELAVPHGDVRLVRIRLDPPARRRLFAVTRRDTAPLPAVEKLVELLLGRPDAG